MKSNDKQKEYWTNSAGKLWVKEKIEKDNMLEPLGNYALSKFSIGKGLNVLDIGCGTGKVSAQLSIMVGSKGHVSGFDLSKTMIDEAVRYSDSLHIKNITFKVKDIQNDKLDSEIFEAAFSRFGVMFFSDPTLAFKNIFNSLKRNGLLTFICWQNQSDNPWYNLGLEVVKKYIELPVVKDRNPGPFAFSDKTYTKEILISSGFKNIDFFEFEKNVELYKGFTLDASIKHYIKTTPIFKEKVELLSVKNKKNLFQDIKNIWSSYYSSNYLLFPSKTWIVSCTK